MTEQYEQIEQNYVRTIQQIRQICETCGRDPKEVRLVVVTKKQTVDKIKAVLDAGAKYLGENYAEEAAEKMDILSDYKDVEWHMIGHIQSRKADLVCRKFAMIHSLDRLKLADKLNSCLLQLGRTIPVLLEVNIAGEESKSGWNLADEKNWADFIQVADELNKRNAIKIKGLMAMPPLMTGSEGNRRYFSKTRKLMQYLNDKTFLGNLTELSMGTSSDYAVAIEEGATMVRIGQDIMGPRSSE